MKKGEIYEGVAGEIHFPNQTVVRTSEGEQAVVKNTLPGQHVRFQINKARHGRYEGRLLEVLGHSDKECLAGACLHSGICGGCLYQTLPYEEQLRIKQGQVKQLLDSVVEDYAFEGIIGSPVVTGYRNKMELSFGDEYMGGPLALGMHKRGSFYDIVTVADCRIMHADMKAVAACVLQHFRAAAIPFYHKMRHEGILRHLLLRRAQKSGELMIALVTTSQLDETALQLDRLTDSIRGLALEGAVTGILHIVNDRLADVVQSDETRLIYGREWIEEDLFGLKFRVTPFSFFQTNSLGAEVLYSVVREYIGETKDQLVFDLYSGTGTIAQVLAPVAKKVLGVEIVEEAVEAARVNAKENGLSNCEFLAGDVLKVLDEIAEKPDLIVLDPPRDGIHPKALKKIIAYGVKRIVYVSCKPTSLVRDLAVLQEEGYQVEKARAVDMFPATSGIETVVLLSRME